MLSQKARYALKAMLFLAQHKGDGPVMIGEIAEQQAVPKKFLELILLDLKKRGLVHSIRGRSGGYVLGRQREDISFAEIIRVIDGPLALAPCASRTAFRKCEDCEDVETCAIRKTLLDVRDATAGLLESRTLAQALPKRRGIKSARKSI